jgi:phenylalanyl-tRNA synthetase beta chain
MKLSLNWIFDHIDADVTRVDVAQLVSLFNQKTAEIESWYPLRIDLELLAVGQITALDEVTATLFIPEYAVTTQLVVRKDIRINDWVMVIKEDNQYAWAHDTHLGGYKNILVPPFYIPESLQQGEWKATLEKQDYILEVDNKSVTHRPDLWGHRGFAREIAALLDVPFKELELGQDISVQDHTHCAAASSSFPFELAILSPEHCSRLGALYINCVTPLPSLLWMAHRLIKTENRAINAIVDTTNYVMLDLGHPLHAFNAETLQGKTVQARMAYTHETLTVLDGEKLSLTSDDMVIADADRAVSLAGVMGGAQTGISQNATAIVLEAACFDATTVRKTAARYKKRTEASARFEKSLDPAMVVTVLRRAVYFLQGAGVIKTVPEILVAVGAIPALRAISVTHSFIEQKLGITITSQVVEKILQKIGFGVRQFTNEQKELTYEITIPSFRATKDITIPEDIVEEVGRFYGYENITPCMPCIATRPSSLIAQQRARTIKTILSYGHAFRELYSYSFYDERVLQQLDWQPTNAVNIHNPISEHWRRLVTSLIPHLLKAVSENAIEHNQLRFYEWARTWTAGSQDVHEQKRLAGIVFNKQGIDFYDSKNIIQDLLLALDMPVTWHKIEQGEYPWIMPYQSAYLKYKDTVIGYAGMVDVAFVRPLFEGSAFIFDIDGDFITQYQHSPARFAPLNKYPMVERDISMLIPITKTAAEIIAHIKTLSALITDVVLVDFFQKQEWQTERSLTIRMSLQDYNKTLTTDQVDVILQQAIDVLQKEGATIR